MKLICTTKLEKISVEGIGDFKNGDKITLNDSVGCQLIKTPNFKIEETPKAKKQEIKKMKAKEV